MTASSIEPIPLTHACAKADWADYHFDRLCIAVDAFCSDSHTIIPKDEPELDRVRYCVYVKQPHVSIFLMCGDYLQCLRTSLDQAVWSLIYHGTGKDSDSSEFPVFECDPKDDVKIRSRFNSKVSGLSDSVIDYVVSLQPYNRPAGTKLSSHPLWQLHQLNRIDKHRRISVQPQVSFAGRNHFGMAAPREDFALMEREDTDYGFDVICAGHYKNLKPKIITFVLFGDEKAGVFLNIDDLGQLHEFVAHEVLVGLASRAQ